MSSHEVIKLCLIGEMYKYSFATLCTTLHVTVLFPFLFLCLWFAAKQRHQPLAGVGSTQLVL